MSLSTSGLSGFFTVASDHTVHNLRDGEHLHYTQYPVFTCTMFVAFIRDMTLLL